MLDPFLSRQNLVKELTFINRAKLLRIKREQSKGKPAAIEEKKPPAKNLRLWQIQNLNFIALLACRLITLDCQSEPAKLLANSKVKRNQLYPIIKEIFKNSTDLAIDEHKVFPFVCMLKRWVKTLMATDVRQAYDAVNKLQCYPHLDYEYYLLNRVQG